MPPWALLVPPVLPERTVLLVLPEQQDQLGSQVRQDLRERPDLQEPLEQPALRVRPDRRVPRVLLVPLARRASKAQLVLRGQPEPKGQPVIPDLLDRLEQLVPQELLVRPDRQAQPELPEPQVRLGRLDPRA